MGAGCLKRLMVYRSPTTSSSMGEVQVCEMDLIPGITLKLPPMRWMLGLFTTSEILRIKLLVCPLPAFPLQRAAAVDCKAFESGLTAQSPKH